MVDQLGNLTEQRYHQVEHKSDMLKLCKSAMGRLLNSNYRTTKSSIPTNDTWGIHWSLIDGGHLQKRFPAKRNYPAIKPSKPLLRSSMEEL